MGKPLNYLYIAQWGKPAKTFPFHGSTEGALETHSRLIVMADKNGGMGVYNVAFLIRT